MYQNFDLQFLSFIVFCQVFFPVPFLFFDLTFYCLFSFFIWFFYRPLFFSSFRSCFVHFFLRLKSNLKNQNVHNLQNRNCWSVYFSFILCLSVISTVLLLTSGFNAPGLCLFLI
jgi:hypothetical protein